MGYPAAVIPEKIFFKIGEVCDLVGVQAHVLRYWETEFNMLSPQKNRSGQRTYRRRDVEIALRIKELLYDEMFTIAGAKKKLQSELREQSRLKIVTSEPLQREVILQPVPTIQPTEEDFEDDPIYEEDFDEVEMTLEEPEMPLEMNSERREALKSLASQLLELSEMVRKSKLDDEHFRLRKY
ncbi:MAG: MerR family transcriptional regulator [Pyrinomonadaceae bacterium]|nr:MerR family transcriptional regulator [Pyrinomonadaceae bacterium]